MEPTVIKVEETNTVFYSGDDNCCPRYIRFWSDGKIDFVAFDEKGNTYDPRDVAGKEITSFEHHGRKGAEAFKKPKA